jgi:hypothetical protein
MKAVIGRETMIWNKGQHDEKILLDRDMVISSEGIEWVHVSREVSWWLQPWWRLRNWWRNRWLKYVAIGEK